MFPRRTVLLAGSALVLAAPALAQPATSNRAARETNVIDTLSTLGGYGQFIRLAQLSGGVELLRGAGPFILLAPGDAAMGRLPASVIAGLAPTAGGATTAGTDPVRLAAFVNSHIIEGRGSLDAVKGQTVAMRTRNGNSVEFVTRPDGVVLVTSTGDAGFGTGGINVDPRQRAVMPEIVASNGVIWPISLPFVV